VKLARGPIQAGGSYYVINVCDPLDCVKTGSKQKSFFVNKISMGELQCQNRVAM
jgi:hypothetical protein